MTLAESEFDFDAPTPGRVGVAYDPEIHGEFTSEQLAKMDNLTVAEREKRDRQIHQRKGFGKFLREIDTLDPFFLEELLKVTPDWISGRKESIELYREWLKDIGRNDWKNLLEALYQEWKIERGTLSLQKTGPDYKDMTPDHVTDCWFMVSGDYDIKVKCGHPVVPGTVRCKQHGGELVNIETRKAVLMTAYLELVQAADTAVSTLVDVALNSRNDIARTAASKEILDRAGLTADLNINVTIDSETTPQERVREKLESVRKGLLDQQAKRSLISDSRSASEVTTRLEISSRRDSRIISPEDPDYGMAGDDDIVDGEIVEIHSERS